MMRLEITESAYTDNPQQLLAAMKELQNYGFQVLMDDFGSGYPSLNMLKDVPVDILKMDMKFLENQGISGRGPEILASLVRMAKKLGMRTIAEGIETKEQEIFCALSAVNTDRAIIMQDLCLQMHLPIC